MSGETEDKVQDVFMDNLGVKYPFALIKPAVKQAYGVRAYPSYYLITPDGEVHSTGRPSESVIEELLEDVRLAPKLPDDSRYAPIARMWEKQDHDKLRSYLSKMLAQENLDADMRVVFEAQQAELEKRASRAADKVTKLAAGPDYYTSREKLEKVEKVWKDFPAGERAAEELKRFSRDSDIKKEIAATKKLRKLLDKYDPNSISQARKLKEALAKFAERNEGTWAATDARKRLSQ